MKRHKMIKDGIKDYLIKEKEILDMMNELSNYHSFYCGLINSSSSSCHGLLSFKQLNQNVLNATLYQAELILSEIKSMFDRFQSHTVNIMKILSDELEDMSASVIISSSVDESRQGDISRAPSMTGDRTSKVSTPIQKMKDKTNKKESSTGKRDNQHGNASNHQDPSSSTLMSFDDYPIHLDYILQVISNDYCNKLQLFEMLVSPVTAVSEESIISINNSSNSNNSETIKTSIQRDDDVSKLRFALEFYQPGFILDLIQHWKINQPLLTSLT